MLSSELLIDAYGRIRGAVHNVLADAGPGMLAYRPDSQANSIAWLVWHLTRVQDDHLSEIMHQEQVWTSGGWAERFALPSGTDATGYGQTALEVGQVRADADQLGGYFDAVHSRTVAWLPTLAATDFARVVDLRWTPPVTLAVRLISVLADDLQHAGQAAYVRGLAERAGL
ncbi:MAG: DUF664 domain-containing protein [Ramlibacter sp.]|nr:DUF664 domain-containing protein [Cryobacterium sp.]